MLYTSKGLDEFHNPCLLPRGQNVKPKGHKNDPSDSSFDLKKKFVRRVKKKFPRHSRKEKKNFIKYFFIFVNLNKTQLYNDTDFSSLTGGVKIYFSYMALTSFVNGSLFMMKCSLHIKYNVVLTSICYPTTNDEKYPNTK